MKPANLAIYKYVSGALFIALLCGMAYTQMHLKKDPQYYLLLLGTLTALFTLINWKEITTILFILMLGVVLFVNYFMILVRLFNDHLGIHSMIYGSSFTIITLFLYLKYYPRQKFFEKVFVLAFFILSLLIFFFYEI